MTATWTSARNSSPPRSTSSVRIAATPWACSTCSTVDAGYCPTHWQKSTLPRAYADKVEVIFDGVDRTSGIVIEDVPRHWSVVDDRSPTRRSSPMSRAASKSMRGFDIFMKVAKRIYQQYPDVLFVVVGEDRIAYGGDLKHIKEKSFKEHVLKQDDYDLSKFVFTGRVPPRDLAKLALDQRPHIYLTVPFVLSWSLFNALSCGAPVVASDTGPVRELIRHEENGLLAGFFDVEGLAAQRPPILRDPQGHRRLGEAGMALIEEKYSLRKTLPRLLAFFRRVVEHGSKSEQGRTEPARRGLVNANVTSSFSKVATLVDANSETIVLRLDCGNTPADAVAVVLSEPNAGRFHQERIPTPELSNLTIDITIPLIEQFVATTASRTIRGSEAGRPEIIPLLVSAATNVARPRKIGTPAAGSAPTRGPQLRTPHGRQGRLGSTSSGDGHSSNSASLFSRPPRSQRLPSSIVASSLFVSDKAEPLDC